MAAPCAEEWLCQPYPSTCDAPARPAGTSSCQRPSFCSLTGRLTSRNGGLDETTVLECKHRTCLVIRRSLEVAAHGFKETASQRLHPAPATAPPRSRNPQPTVARGRLRYSTALRQNAGPSAATPRSRGEVGEDRGGRAGATKGPRHARNAASGVVASRERCSVPSMHLPCRIVVSDVLARVCPASGGACFHRTVPSEEAAENKLWQLQINWACLCTCRRPCCLYRLFTQVYDSAFTSRTAQAQGHAARYGHVMAPAPRLLFLVREGVTMMRLFKREF